MARIQLASKVAANNLSARLHRIARLFGEIHDNYSGDEDLRKLICRGQYLAIDALDDIEKVVGFKVYRNVAPRSRPKLREVHSGL